MPHGIHKHGRGWRGTLSVSTATYATESEAAAALEALRALLNVAATAAQRPAGRPDARSGLARSTAGWPA
jgi:hypothetical protein